MKIVVAGSRHFGAVMLQELFRAHYEIAAVVAPTGTDRLGVAALDLGLPLVALDSRPKVDAADIPEGTDLIVAAHSHAFVTAAALRKARLGGIGYHPSLLPRHRGNEAVEWTIRCGDAIAGGSVYQLTAVMDAGPIVAQDWCFVHPGETARQLWERALSPLGIRLLSKAVASVAERGMIEGRPQEEEAVTWAPPRPVQA